MTRLAWAAFAAATAWVVVYLAVIAGEDEPNTLVVAVVAGAVVAAGACLPLAARLVGRTRRIVAATGASVLTLVAVLAALSIGALLLPAAILGIMATMRA
jgi:hypothetical protein